MEQGERTTAQGERNSLDEDNSSPKSSCAAAREETARKDEGLSEMRR